MCRDNIEMSSHALYKFSLKSGRTNDEGSKETLREMLNKARPIRLKEQFRVFYFLKYGFKITDYYKHGEWVLVVQDNKLITVHFGEAKRWEEIPKDELSRNSGIGQETRMAKSS